MRQQRPPEESGSATVAPVRKVLFFGKNMSRSRCTGGLVDAMRCQGLDVRWVNLATSRRWLGTEGALSRARRVFDRYRPDMVFVFCQDLPKELLREFGRQVPVVLWVEERFDTLDPEMVDYMSLARLVCVSNPAHRDALARHGITHCEFLMSGFSPRFHSPTRAGGGRPRDIVFVGGPGRHGRRAHFVAALAEEFDVEVFGVEDAWAGWAERFPKLNVGPQANNQRFRRICANARIVLGLNQFNNDRLYFSNRTFLTLACRGFHLTHYVPGLEEVFGDGVHLAWYRGLDECIEQTARYLADPSARARIAQQGYELVHGEHQYYHRVGAVLELLGARIAEQRPMRPSAAPARAAAPALRSSVASSTS